MFDSQKIQRPNLICCKCARLPGRGNVRAAERRAALILYLCLVHQLLLVFYPIDRVVTTHLHVCLRRFLLLYSESTQMMMCINSCKTYLDGWVGHLPSYDERQRNSRRLGTAFGRERETWSAAKAGH
jgi:hypothetical protein